MARARAARSGLARWRCADWIPGASLVLVDGRRVTRVLGGTFVDINTIPLAAVESIEILKSGASAVYGADAVAGVVNIHLWKDFRGAQLSQYYGNTMDKDAGLYKADVLFGVGDDKMSITGDIFYFHHNSTFNRRLCQLRRPAIPELQFQSMEF